MVSAAPAASDPTKLWLPTLGKAIPRPWFLPSGTPARAIEYVQQMRVANAVLSGQRPDGEACWLAPIPDRLNLSGRQLTPDRHLPWQAHSAPLLVHVIGVVLRRAGEQVIRPYARRVVAVVERPEAVRERLAAMNPPRDMGRSSEPTHIPDLSVTGTIGRPGPHPTRPKFRPNDRSVLVNLYPETRFNRRRSAQPLVLAGRSTEALRRVAKACEWLLARLACVDGRHAPSGGTIRLHRDLPLTRNRGATPGAVTSSDRASLCLHFTTPDQERRSAA